MLIHQAIPLVVARFPSLAPEIRAVGVLIEGQPGGWLALPAVVLAAALEAIAFGGHASGTYNRRWSALEASVFLQEEGGYRPAATDFSVAVGLWSAVIARAAGGYRAHAANSESDVAHGRTSPAEPIAAVLTILATDLAVLVAASEELRKGGRRHVLKEVTSYVAHHPGMKGPSTNAGNPPLMLASPVPARGNSAGVRARRSPTISKKRMAGSTA